MSDSETDLQAGAGEPAAPEASNPQPSYTILYQFLRDLSFENPSTPVVQLAPDVQPSIDVKVDVTAKALGQDVFEVELHMEFKASAQEHTLYMGEIIYAGVVRVEAVAQEDVELVLLIEVPRMLFPFARSIVGNATRDGGFPTLFLTPFDFMALYNKRLQRRAEEAQG